MNSISNTITINGDYSTIKFALYERRVDPKEILLGRIENIVDNFHK